MSKKLSFVMAIVMAVSCSQAPRYSSEELRSMGDELTELYAGISHRVIRPAEGYLKYDYLIPAGFYKQMWDWDGYFMGYYWAEKGRPELLKYWALNLISNIDERGYVCGCATVNGPRLMHGDFSMKPFLSQGIFLASEALGDYSWVEPIYEQSCRALAFRDSTQYDPQYGLYFWDNGFQSGADNNVALNYFKGDTRSFLATDCSTMQLRELKAQARIAAKLGHDEDSRMFSRRADSLAAAINRYLWCDEDKCYYNVDRSTGDFYKRVSYSCFWPLVEGLASQQDGREMLRKYMFSEKYMKAASGFRTLSVSDPDYNNKNIIKPFSNWQGPVWVISSYIYSLGLHRYGFDDEIAWMTGRLGELVIADIKAVDSTHECYHADTGEPLSPAPTYVDENGKFIGFISWNLLLELLFDSVNNGVWHTMEI